MGKGVVKGMWILLAVTVGFFSLLLYGYWRENQDLVEKTEEKREIVILSTYEVQATRDALFEIVEAYMNQNPEVNITIRFVGSSDFQKEISLEKDNDQLSDLIICDNVMTPALVSMGIFQDISGVMNEQKADEYLEVAYNTTLVNGRSYAVPFTCDPYVLFYNKDYFARNSIPVPKTLEELRVAVCSMQTLGNYNFAIACKEVEDLSASFLQLIYLYGGNILDLDGAGSLKFYEMMQEFRDKNVVPQDMVNWNQQDLMHYFEDGMVTTAVARLSSATLLEQEQMDFNYSIIEIPYELNQVLLFHGENIGITAKEEDIQVQKLLQYLTSKEAVYSFAEKSGKLSVRVESVNLPVNETELGEGFMERVKNQSIAKNSYSSWFLISTAISEQMITFLTTSTEAEEAARQMQDTVREAIMER